MTKHTSIAAALSALQGDMPTVKKNKTVRTGKYSYAYADLASVMEALAPHLKTHGLAFSALPVTDEHGFRLEGHLMHESGERLTGSLPLNGRTPQEIGSALTYARRYLLGCLTGVVTDEDDDGQLAQAAGQRGNSLRDRIQPTTAVVPVTEDQTKKIMALFNEVGTLRDATVTRANRLTAYTQWAGRDIQTTSELTKSEAAHVIDRLDSWVADLQAAAEANEGELVQGELIEDQE